MATPRRLAGVDAARGVALLGMIAVHLMDLVTPQGPGPTVVGLVFAGKSSALFATLAGVGLALLTGGPGTGHGPHQGARVAWDRRQVAVRAGLLFVVGLACGTLDSGVAVILAHYAVLFLLALPFLRLGARVLAAWAAGWVLLSPLVASLLSGAMQATVGSEAYLDDWVLWTSPTLLDLIVRPGLLAWDLLFTGYYPVLQWFGYLLFGLFLGRLRLSTWWVSGALAVGGAALAAGAFLVSRGLQSIPGVLGSIAAGTGVGPAWLEAELLTGDSMETAAIQHTPLWFTLATPHSGAPLDLLLTCGTSAMVLGVCLLLCKVGGGVLAYPLTPLIGAGAMTLTLYVAHLVALAAFGPVTAGWSETGLLIAYWAGCLVAGTAWRVCGWKGPLERLLSVASTTVAGPRPAPVAGPRS